MSEACISCTVLTWEDGQEVEVAQIKVANVPRVGEYLWFSQAKRGATSWKVTLVAHWVGDGLGYHTVALYVEQEG